MRYVGGFFILAGFGALFTGELWKVAFNLAVGFVLLGLAQKRAVSRPAANGKQDSIPQDESNSGTHHDNGAHSRWDQTQWYSQSSQEQNQQSQANDSQENNAGAGDGQMSVEKARDILGVSELSTPAEVKQAYRKLIVKWHPDKLSDMAPELQKMATEQTAQINAAYELLSQADVHAGT